MPSQTRARRRMMRSSRRGFVGTIIIAVCVAMTIAIAGTCRPCFAQEVLVADVGTATASDAVDAVDAVEGVDGVEDILVGDVTDLGDVVGDSMMDAMDPADAETSTASGTVEGMSAEEAAETATDAGEGGAVDADGAVTEPPERQQQQPPDHQQQQEQQPEQQQQQQEQQQQSSEQTSPPVQSGPFIDLLGPTLLSLEMVDETHAQVHQHYTNEILAGKKVVGLYFSADWCGPCRQFTPDLVSFYQKINSRPLKKDQFEIVWISRCRTIDDFGQYFTQMNWLALPPQEAMGQRGQYLGEKYKVKSIPTLVLLDEVGNVITTDGRNKIPMDKAGIGFPWRSPWSVLVEVLVPRSLRVMIKSQIGGIWELVRGVVLGKKNKKKL